MVSGERGRPMLPTSATPAIAAAVSLVVLGALACARASDEARRGAGERPARIITIGGPVTEAVFALGAGARVIAVDVTSTYPAAVAALPKVGYLRALAAEGLLALDPELVLASADAGPPATLDALRAAGVRVELLPPADTVISAADRLRAIGRAIGEPGPADGLAERLEVDGAAAVAAAAPPSGRVLFLYARGAGAPMVSGRDTTAAAMLALVGATPAITAWSGYRPLTAEAIVAARPDAIVVPARVHALLGGTAGVLALPGMAETPAGQARRVVAVDDQLLLGFGPRLPEAIATLDRALAGAP
jgi:iron complex transport system substrate-binding protein